ncbi:MAG: hypothetical protein WBD22_06320 [Pyrinomonadaceae bacterium]
MGIVAELLLHGGTLPQLAELTSKSTVLTRRNGIGFSVLWFLFFLLILAPLWGIVDVEELAAASAVIGIFGGLMFLISSMIFLKKPVSFAAGAVTELSSPVPVNLRSSAVNPALPPQQVYPASDYVSPGAGLWRDTNDLQPSSVTESTTKLLEKNK